jgi:hypothetical protein
MSDGAGVAQAIVTGEAEYGVLPVSEILPVPGLAVAGEFPSELDAYVRLEGAVRTGLPADAPPHRVLAALISARAAPVFERRGFRR